MEFIPGQWKKEKERKKREKKKREKTKKKKKKKRKGRKKIEKKSYVGRSVKKPREGTYESRCWRY